MAETIQRKKILVNLLVLVAVVFAAILVYLKPDKTTITVKQLFLREGLERCKTNKQKFNPTFTENRSNPRYQLFKSKPVLIVNATIIDGDGTISSSKQDILLENGAVSAIISSNSRESSKLVARGIEIIDANNHYVSPGLVEMHSHVGICTQPELKGVNDMFELMYPVTPYTRVIDAFNVGDPAIEMSLSGGVTSALILPSANLISGEGFVFKMSVPESLSAEQMLVQYSGEAFENSFRQRWMKMACGENPKKRYTAREDAPKSRMGLGHLFRKTMQQAQRLKDEQDLWCEQIYNGQLPLSRYPENDDLDLLVELLRGKVLSNAHCYETFDIETLLRHAREFGIEINTLHHALDAYRIPETIKSQPYNISIATFATLWGHKKEAFQGSLFGPKILEENDITVILTTDHPAIAGHTLLNQAQIAHHYGLSAEKAFASITGEPATALNLGNRIGFLRKGYDADVIIWSDHPLNMRAKPLKVFVDGKMLVNQPLIEGELNDVSDSIPKVSEAQLDLRKFEGSGTYLITGITKSFIPGYGNSSQLQLLVADNEIICFAEDCSKLSIRYSNIPKLELQNAYISPMLTSLTPSHGIAEMALEPMTGDGVMVKALEMSELSSFRNPSNVPKAKYGLQLGSVHLSKAFNLGTGIIITPPFRGEGQLFVSGVSVAFWSNSETLENVKDEVALHITIGDQGKQKEVPTISLQFAALKEMLLNNQDTDNIYGKVLSKELPLAIHTNNKDVMLHIIELKNTLDLDIIIVGGIESHLIAHQLASNDIPVVVTPWRCQRRFWDERRCLLGVNGQSTVLKELHSAGVRVALAPDDDVKVRVSLQDAGLAAALSDIPIEDVMYMLTDAMNDIFHLPPTNNNFFISQRNPLDYGSRISVIIRDGVLTKIYPDIEPNNNPFIPQ